MPFHEFGDIELGFLQNLHLADVAIFDGEDGRGLLDDLVANVVGNKFLHERSQISLCSKFLHGGNHLGADGTDLSRFGIASVLDLVRLLFGESNAKHSHNVTIGCSAVNVTLNDGLLFSDQTAQLITGHVHTVEIQQTVVSLDIFDTKLNLSVCKSFVLLQISETHFENTSLKVFGGNFGTLGFGNKSLSAVLLGEHGGSNKLVPFFLQEGVNGLFAASLLSLSEVLVLTLLSSKQSKEQANQAETTVSNGSLI